MADEETPDPGASFAALMSDASKAAKPAGGEAPYGFTIDRETGEHRPKKTAGRPRVSKKLEDLKAEKAAREAAKLEADRPQASAEDRPPGKPAKGRNVRAADNSSPAPQHRPGVITKGINRLYRRTGKIVRVMDKDIGLAIIASTQNTADDADKGGDDSVGAAWDELAKTNPRIRRVLLKLCAGGAWGQVVMAHAPIFMALLMKDSISRHIPFMTLLGALTEPDEDASAEDKAEAVTPGDLAQAMAMAQQLADNMMNGGRAAAPGSASGKTAA